MIFVGEKLGKGIAFRFTVVADSNDLKTSALYTTSVFSAATVNDSNKAVIKAPTGGMGQFKGLTQGTQQDKYVQVICNGVQPMYYTTYGQKLDTETSNGWVVTCYTGIAQCA